MQVELCACCGKPKKPKANPGRWPPNLALIHHPECRRVGEWRVRGSQGVRGGGGVWSRSYQASQDYRPEGDKYPWENNVGQAVGYTDPDGLETIAAWDCHESCPARRLGEQSGELKSGARQGGEPFKLGRYEGQKGAWGLKTAGSCESSEGTAARFFFQAAWNLERADPVLYCAKASRKERDAGLEGMVLQHAPKGNYEGRDLENPKNHLGGLQGSKQRNPHPTVKPIALAQWLATLLLPPPEYAPRRLLIPFAGSGSEGIGAGLAGWDEMTLIEMDPETCAIAEARLAHWLKEPRQMTLEGGG